MVDTIGRFPLPVEVIPFGSQQVFNKMAKEGLNPEFRMTADGQHVLTDSKTTSSIYTSTKSNIPTYWHHGSVNKSALLNMAYS